MELILKRKVLFILIGCLFILSFFSVTYSQKQDVENKSFFGLTPQKSSFSLLDPSRLKMSHSYTFSYFSSKKSSGSFGLYLNTIQYQISEPLKLTMNLGYLHRSSFWQRSGNSFNTQGILSDFQLEYKKSNFHFLLKIGNLPENRNPYIDWLYYYLSDWYYFSDWRK